MENATNACNAGNSMLGIPTMSSGQEVDWDTLISVAGDILAFQAIPHCTSLTARFLINDVQYVWYYQSVRRPFWDVLGKYMNWVFAATHTAIGAASYIVYKCDNNWLYPAAPLALCGVQLLFDFAWRPLYFNQKNWDRAFRHSALCTTLSTALYYAYWRIDYVAGCLVLPYAVWWAYLTTVVWYVRLINDPPEPWRRLSFGGYPMYRRTSFTGAAAVSD